jgi:CubicO group peptidase (beta-lactamase class C family)
MRPHVALLFLCFPAALHAQDVDRVFARFQAPGSPGCAVAASRDGAPVLARAYGRASLEHDVPNTPETVFEAGSVSKQFTAAAVHVLARQGKLRLDDDVRRHLPELPEYVRTITLRHLMSHTSGLRDWGTVAEAAGWPRGSRVYTHGHVLDVVRRQRALNYAPGAEYLYSNTGYSLLAMVVERVSGERFADFTRRVLFEPAGMASTSWRDDFARVVPGRAVAYDTARGAFRTAMPFENTHGHAGLLTTVGDLLRWNEALARGAVGGPGMYEEMQRRGVLATGRRIPYASGLVVGEHRGVPEVAHSGATAGYRAYLARYPLQRLSVALLCNDGTANPTALAQAVADSLLGGAARAPAAAPAVPLSADELRTRAGLYRSVRTGEPLRLAVRDGRLRNDAGAELVPLSATRFRLGRAQVVFADVPAGRRAPFLLLAADGDTLAYEPAAEAPPADPAALAGEYRSDEAEATYTVAVRDGRPVLLRRPDAEWPLTSAYADAFTTPQGWLVRFERDRAGRVTALRLGMGRVRDLRFARVRTGTRGAAKSR